MWTLTVSRTRSGRASFRVTPRQVQEARGEAAVRAPRHSASLRVIPRHSASLRVIPRHSASLRVMVRVTLRHSASWFRVTPRLVRRVTPRHAASLRVTPRHSASLRVTPRHPASWSASLRVMVRVMVRVTPRHGPRHSTPVPQTVRSERAGLPGVPQWVHTTPPRQESKRTATKKYQFVPNYQSTNIHFHPRVSSI